MENQLSETIGQIGEREFLRRITPYVQVGQQADGGYGIGDDCAIISAPSGECRPQVITTDLLIEGTHFLNNEHTVWRWIGRKAIGSNISDIAAMAGSPSAIVVALGLPPHFPVSHALDLYRGMHQMAIRYGAPFVGGDLARSPVVTINITVLGSVNPSYSVGLRNQARPGDYLYVSGPLGGSRAGLDIILRPDHFTALPLNLKRRLIRRHFSPTPQVGLAETLAVILLTPMALIDISDSLFNEASLLAEASGVQLNIELDSIPVSPDVRTFCAALPADPQEFALYSGEEYELLAALPHSPDELQRDFPGCWLTCIGRVTQGAGVQVTRHDHPIAPPNQTFQHFD